MILKCLVVGIHILHGLKFFFSLNFRKDILRLVIAQLYFSVLGFDKFVHIMKPGRFS